MTITQHELDNARVNSKYIQKVKALEIIGSNFDNALKQLKIRSAYEQTIIGTLLTSLEIEIKKDLKGLEEKII